MSNLRKYGVNLVEIEHKLDFLRQYCVFYHETSGTYTLRYAESVFALCGKRALAGLTPVFQPALQIEKDKHKKHQLFEIQFHWSISWKTKMPEPRSHPKLPKSKDFRKYRILIG